MMLNVISSVVAYQSKDSKPQLNITASEFNAIAVIR